MFRSVSRRGTPIALQQAPSVPPRTIVAARGCLRGQLPPRETSAAIFAIFACQQATCKATID
jgi:hypothetical protein